MEERRAQQRAETLVVPGNVTVGNPGEAVSELLREKNDNKFSITELMQQLQNSRVFCHRSSYWHLAPRHQLHLSLPGSPSARRIQVAPALQQVVE